MREVDAIFKQKKKVKDTYFHPLNDFLFEVMNHGCYLTNEPWRNNDKS